MGWMFSITLQAISLELDLAFLPGGWMVTMTVIMKMRRKVYDFDFLGSIFSLTTADISAHFLWRKFFNPMASNKYIASTSNRHIFHDDPNIFLIYTQENQFK